MAIDKVMWDGENDITVLVKKYEPQWMVVGLPL